MLYARMYQPRKNVIPCPVPIQCSERLRMLSRESRSRVVACFITHIGMHETALGFKLDRS